MFSNIVMPILIVAIMFGMGLTLTRADFSNLFKMPKSILVGLICQITALPIIGLLMCILFNLPGEICVGIMLISACPGGALSNVVSQLCKGNLPLSISLTGISTLVCVISAPLVLSISSSIFITEDPLSFSTLKISLGVFVVSVIPVIIGIRFKELKPKLAESLAPKFEKLSSILIAIMVVGVLIQQKGVFLPEIKTLTAACLSLNVTAIMIGSCLALLVGLSRVDAFTLGIESGIQNAALALVISSTFLNNATITATVITYGLTMTMTSIVILATVKYLAIGKLNLV